MQDRHAVPTLLDTPDGIGAWTTRQLALVIGAGLFVGPAAAMVVPSIGPVLGDIIAPGFLPLSGAIAWATPVLAAGVAALPLTPPPEHGVIAWTKYRAHERMLGPAAIDELIGHPTVAGDVAHIGGRYVAMWEMPSISMRLASDAARAAERSRWAAFLDGLPCPIQTTVRATPVDLDAVLKQMAVYPNPNAPLIAGHLRASTAAGGEIERRRYLSISADDEAQLGRYAEDIDGGLARAVLAGKRLSQDDLADALHAAWTARPRKGLRIGPSTLRIEPDGLYADGAWLTTLAMQRWPGAVTTDWQAPFYDGASPIDVVQIIRPQDTLKVRRNLEDRLQRLTTTTETRERLAAIAQLNAMLDALQGSGAVAERVFEVEIYYTVRATTTEQLANRRRRIEQIAGESGGEAKPLRWEHAEAAVSTQGAAESRLVGRTRRVDTSSLSRTYPWAASELGLRGAVPWGRTLYGNRRITWTPFRRPQIANPGTALWMTSGAGKGMSVKIWTSRALFAGVISECFAIDQAEESEDGEYGRWARYCGGEIRKLRRQTWEQDLQHALADIRNGTLPPVVVLNTAELGKYERCRAFVALKRAVWTRGATLEAPRSLIVDEMHSYQDDPEAVDEGEDLVRRSRHIRLACFYMTQRPQDALDSALGKTVQSVCATQIFGMQSPAEISDVSVRLRWTPEQIQVIERFGPGDALLTTGLHRVAFRVDFSPEEWAMAHTDWTDRKGVPDGRTERHLSLALADAAPGGTVPHGALASVARLALDAASPGHVNGSTN